MPGIGTRVEDLGRILRHSARRSSSLSSNAHHLGIFEVGLDHRLVPHEREPHGSRLRERTQVSNQRIAVAGRGGHAGTRGVE